MNPAGWSWNDHTLATIVGLTGGELAALILLCVAIALVFGAVGGLIEGMLERSRRRW